MPEDTHLKSIDRKLDLLVRMSAYQMVSGKTIMQAAPILKRIGFTNSEIASVFGTTVGTVSVGLARSKKTEKKKAQKEDG